MQSTEAYSIKYTNNTYNSTAKEQPSQKMGRILKRDISPKKTY